MLRAALRRDTYGGDKSFDNMNSIHLLGLVIEKMKCMEIKRIKHAYDFCTAGKIGGHKNMKKIINLVIAAAIAVSSALVTVPAMAADTYSEKWDFEKTVFDGNDGDGLYRWPVGDQAEIVEDDGVNGSKGFKLATTIWSQLYKQGLDLTQGVYEFGASVRLTKNTPHVLFRFGSSDKADKDNTAFTIAEINNGSINLNGKQECGENKIAKTINAETWYTLDAIVDLDSKYCLVTVTDAKGSVYAKNRYTIPNENIGWFGFNIPWAASMPDKGNVYVDNMYIKSFNDNSVVLVDDDFSSYTSDSEDNYLPYFGGGYPENGADNYKRATGNMAEGGVLKLTGGYAVRYIPIMAEGERGWLSPKTAFITDGKLRVDVKINVPQDSKFELKLANIANNSGDRSFLSALYIEKGEAHISGSVGSKFFNYKPGEDVNVTLIYDPSDGNYQVTLAYTDREPETHSSQATFNNDYTGIGGVWLDCGAGIVNLDDLKITHITGEEPAEPDVILGKKAAISGQLEGAEINENGELISDGETISAWTITAAADKFKTGDTIKATLNTGEISSSKLGVIPKVEGGEITFYVLINRAADSVQSVEFTPAQ